MKGWGLTEPRTEPGSLGHGDVCVGGRGGGARGDGGQSRKVLGWSSHEPPAEGQMETFFPAGWSWNFP